MDPYLEFEYKGLKYRTKPHIGGGENPEWNERVEIAGI